MFINKYKKIIEDLSVKLENVVNENTNIQHELKEVRSHNEGLLNILEEYKSELKVLEFHREKNSELIEDIKNYKNVVYKYLVNHIESMSCDSITELYGKVRNSIDDGSIEVNIVSKLIPIDIYSHYSYEAHLGVFASDDIYGMIPYYEKYKYGKTEYHFVGNVYEVGVCVNEYWHLDEYKHYRKVVEKKVLLKLCEKKPLKVLNIL